MATGKCAVVIVMAVTWLCSGGQAASCQGWDASAFNSSLTVFRAPDNKPPIEGRPLIINHLNKEADYGYIGSQCLPGFDLPDEGPTSNKEWRVVCKKPSELFVVVMAINMSSASGDYLQMRRRGVRGVSLKFEAFNLKKNSVVFAHVTSTSANTSSNATDSQHLSADGRTGFRLAYFCIGVLSDATNLAEQILLNRNILDYLAVEPKGIDAAAQFLYNTSEAYFSPDPVVSHIRNLLV